MVYPGTEEYFDGRLRRRGETTAPPRLVRKRSSAATVPAQRALAFLVLLGVVAACAGPSLAQDLEPRRWTPLPVGTNVFGVGYEYRTGEIRLDPALRIKDTTFQLHTAAVAYNRYFSLLNRTARIDLQLPFQSGRWRGLVNGEKTSISRTGLADPRIRLSCNLYGAPAMSTEEYVKYIRENSERTTVGVALAVRLPLGKYEDDKFINLGQNRFTFRPQLGVVHTQGPWSFEFTGSTSFYTENNDFYYGNSLQQDPLFGVQAHVIRTLGTGFWISGGLAYDWGGATKVNGSENDDKRSTLLYGISFGIPVRGNQSLRMAYIRTDTLVDTGTDAQSLLLTWVVRF